MLINCKFLTDYFSRYPTNLVILRRRPSSSHESRVCIWSPGCNLSRSSNLASPSRPRRCRGRFHPFHRSCCSEVWRSTRNSVPFGVPRCSPKCRRFEDLFWPSKIESIKELHRRWFNPWLAFKRMLNAVQLKLKKRENKQKTFPVSFKTNFVQSRHSNQLFDGGFKLSKFHNKDRNKRRKFVSCIGFSKLLVNRSYQTVSAAMGNQELWIFGYGSLVSRTFYIEQVAVTFK